MIISSNNTPDLAPQRFQATLRKKSIPSSMYQHKPDGTKSLWSHMQSTTAHKVTPLGTPAAPWLPARPKGDPAVHHPRSTVARRAAFWGQSHMPINACNMQTLKQAYAQAYSFHWQEVPNTEVGHHARARRKCTEQYGFHLAANDVWSTRPTS